MPTYERCEDTDKSVDKFINTLKLFTADHTRLEQNQVTINALFAYPDVSKRGVVRGPALKVHGYPAAACIKITSYKDRVKGMADAELIIDHEWWANHNEEECRALLDHELTHLSVTVDKRDHPKRDKAGRPQLEMRLHDLEIGFFHSIARRHAASSPEYQQGRKFMEPAMVQLYFPDFIVTKADQLLEDIEAHLQQKEAELITQGQKLIEKTKAIVEGK